jgi:hypothetical protein
VHLGLGFCLRIRVQNAKKGAVGANVQILISLFTHWFFMFQTILSKLRKWEKYGINSGIVRQFHAGITINMLPPLGLIPPFRFTNSDVFPLNIAGLSRKNIITTL